MLKSKLIWLVPFFLLILILIGGGIQAWQLLQAPNALQKVVNPTLSLADQLPPVSNALEPRVQEAVVTETVQPEPKQSVAVAATEATTIEASPVTPTPPQLILRLHGSNTIGAKLAPALVEAFLHEKGYVDIEKVPQADLEVIIQGRKPGETTMDAVEIKAHGSSTAFAETDKNTQVGLLEGYCDVGMSSSPVKSTWVETFRSRGFGDLDAFTQEHVIALDGLAAIVHPDNPLQQLTVEQLKAIFLGEVKDWSALGGAIGPIKLYSRDQQSGTYDTFKHIVLGGVDLACDAEPQLTCFEDSKALAAHVSSDPAGIGFIGLNYVGTNKALKISKSAGVQALSPNRFTIKTEDYPLGRRLFLYQTNRPSPLAAEFIQFTLSEQGQKIVSDTGLIEVALQDAKEEQAIADIDADKQRLLADPLIPLAYKDLIRQADRRDTPLTLRFQTGTTTLDNRAQRDLGRLVAKLTKPEFQGSSVILIGFTDSAGAAARNLSLSQQRAQQVASLLTEQGLAVSTATGFGEEPALLLDAREDNADSLAKNRRVEVWLLRP